MLSLVTIALVIIGAVVLGWTFANEVDRQSSITDQLEPAAALAGSLQAENARTAAGVAKYVVTGDADELAVVEMSRDESARLLRALGSVLTSEPELESEVNTAAQAHAAWLKDVIEPILGDMEIGRAREAVARVDSATFEERFEELDGATARAVEAIERARSQGLLDLRSITRDLGVALALTAILAIGIAIFSILALRRWILTPLDRVRTDLREAALLPSHETPIRRTGPTEIAELAADAEELRRELLREIDAAQAARFSLVHGAPAVVALQEALAPAVQALPDGLCVFGTTRAAEGVVAGDWWDAITLEAGAIGLIIADVSGHDLDAGVTAVALRSAFRTGLLAGLAPHAVMALAAVEIGASKRTATAVIAIVQPGSGVIQWANAGHHPPILVAAGQTVRLCEGTGPLLSQLGGIWRTDEALFQRGDVCFAYTDGLVESLDPDGAELGQKGLLSLIAGLEPAAQAEPSELSERVMSQVRQRAKSWDADDVTILAFGKTADIQSGAMSSRL